MPTRPLLSRKASRSSPRILIFLGGPSRSGSSRDSRAGCQKRRSKPPIGVSAPLLVRKSLSALLNMALPSTCRFRQSLLQIGDDVLCRLDANRQADHVRTRAGRHALLVGELAMCRRSGMDDQALGIADVGDMREEIDAVDQLHAGRIAALEAEGEDRAGALGQVFPGELVILVRWQAGVIHPRHG